LIVPKRDLPRPRRRIGLSLYISRAKLALATRGAPDVPTNVYPRNLDFEGRKRPLLLRFTRSLSVPSMNLIVFSSTRSPAYRELTNRLQSSAYLQKLSPRLSKCLSSSSRTISDRIGLRFEPCGVPSSRGETRPFCMMPLRK